jgi:hypothetical protein
MHLEKAISGNRRYAAADLWTDRYPQILEVLEQGRTCGEPGLLDLIQGGTFVCAYLGDEWLEPRDAI